MLKMTVEPLYNGMDMSHSVFLNGERIGGVYVYQTFGVNLGVHIASVHAATYDVKEVRTLTDGVKWLVVKEAMHNA